MRILAMTNLYPNPYQPHRATFNRQQFRALAEMHEIRVIAPIAWTDEIWARVLGPSKLSLNRKVRCDGLSVLHPRYRYTPLFLRQLYGQYFEWSVRATFHRMLRLFQPDLLFAPWIYPDGWAAVRLAHRAGLPVVLKAHGSDVLLSSDYAGREQQTVEAMRNADAVVAVSRDLARNIEASGVPGDKIRVIYDGINSQRFHPGPQAEARGRLKLPPDKPMALFVGSFLPVKGVDILMRACSRLVESRVDFGCYLIGEGPLRTMLEREIADRRLADHVKLVGPVKHALLPDWFRAADVFVLPSRSEGTPCVLLEALACATPFVASRVGGIPEIADLGPNRLVMPENAEDLSAALEDYLRHPRRVAGFQGFSRTHAQAVAELTEFFQQAIDRFHSTHRGKRNLAHR